MKSYIQFYSFCISAFIFLIQAQAATLPYPDWVVFPEEEWIQISPEEAGLDVDEWNAYLRSKNPQPEGCGGSIHKGGRWGAAHTKGGYLLTTFGDPNYIYQNASVGKLVNHLLVQVAIDQGLCTGSEPITELWPDSPHSCDEKATLDDLLKMEGGYETSNGFKDGCVNDNCGEVGTRHYSSGGQWRLMQVLTYLFNEDLKTVLDREVFSKIGIAPEDWYFMTGQSVYENKAPPNAHPDQHSLYPEWTADDRWYGCFVDAPYEINGHPVRGGGGWVGMSPLDWCRIGHLYACGGYWKGEKIVTDTWRLRGHQGCGPQNEMTFTRAEDHISASAWTAVLDADVEEKFLKGPVKRKQ